MARSRFGFEPFHRLSHLQDALDRAFEGPFADWWKVGPSTRSEFPAIDVFSRPEGYVFRMEVPGLDPQNITIDARGRSLSVSGKRETTQTGDAFHRRERWSGEFARTFELPEDLEGGKAVAKYRNGVLTIEVPRREAAKPQQIEVRVS